jgi:hypothetical protein
MKCLAKFALLLRGVSGEWERVLGPPRGWRWPAAIYAVSAPSSMILLALESREHHWWLLEPALLLAALAIGAYLELRRRCRRPCPSRGW